jgi:peptidoglycan/LPS O-acetylase OafA/YrhL
MLQQTSFASLRAASPTIRDSMTTLPVVHSGSTASGVGGRKMAALSGLRFLAALHVLVFHLYCGHCAHRADLAHGMAFPAFDHMPAALVNLAAHGYCATSFFFLLSGFVLTYLYVDAAGALTVTDRKFWTARFARVYPLHLLILAGLAPGMVYYAGRMHLSAADLAVSGSLAAGLLQAWVPRYAMHWNYPTWALSAIAFFYVVFPWLTRRLREMGRRRQLALLAALPALALAPSLAYLFGHAELRPDHAFWHEFIMRDPLLWLPHFLMGVLLARVAGLSRHGDAPGEVSEADRWPVSWGDVAALTVLAIELFNTAAPEFVLRHGALAPLFLIVIHDFARGRGVLARWLSLPVLQSLGEASFSMFMWQFPVQMLFKMALGGRALPPFVDVALVVATTVAVSLASVRWFEKPAAEWLRRRLAPRTAPAAGMRLTGAA